MSQKAENEQHHAEITERVTEWKEEFGKLQTDNENTMHGHKIKLNDNKVTLVKHREMLEENKHMMTMNQDLINKISSKLERIRDALSNELASNRDTLKSQIDQVDKYYNEEMT